MPLLVAILVLLGVLCADQGMVILGVLLCLAALAVGLVACWIAGAENVG